MNSDASGLIEINTFLATPPPRQVPASVIRAAAPIKGLIGIIVFGGIFLSMGLIFSWVFFPRHLLEQWKLGHAPTLTTPGKITAVEETKVSVNDQKIFRYGFSYRPDSGGTQGGTAYANGSRWSKGSPVTVRYLVEEPTLAVPEGARLSVGSASSCTLLIFPLLGGAILFFSINSVRVKRLILRDGRVTTATVNSIEKTNVEVNDRPQFKIHLTRTDDRSAIMKRSSDPTELALAGEKMKSAQPMKILYDPAKPKHFLFPETWKG